MSVASKKAEAEKLESARQAFEDRLRQALEAHEKETGESVALELHLEQDPRFQGADAGRADLLNRISDLVDAFHEQAVVQESGVRVQRVTALDSNEDGRVALDVKYFYRR